ncbi:MAG: 4Fe-4S dicluster domain-containing protein [Candidatus Alcyoniella australis]|nr:4Fe-4S dicluster domain-containing protein [Candidatus Alcyoniella australis]
MNHERLRRLISRPYRLTAFAALLALAFVPGRLYILLALAVMIAAVGLRDRKRGGMALVWPLLGVLGVALLVQINARGDARSMAQFYEQNTPVNLTTVPDGEYFGEAAALNGPLQLELRVERGAIADVTLTRNQETAYAFDDLLAQVRGMTSTDLSGMAGFVFRNQRDTAAFQHALEDALLAGREDRPKLSPISRAAFFVSENRAGRITFNALAILFIVLLLFDFVLQPALVPGTGQSLTCYNCQACVGVCPIKMVGSDPFPMVMVLEARTGNYQHVAELAKYCVGCGKCAAKCPVGNSGPSVAAASVLQDRQRRRDEARRETARARQVPGA